MLGKGAKRVIGVGRVKTPTMGIVCKRELENRSTKRKERHMASIKIISQKIAAWRRYRQSVRELSAMSDHELSDIEAVASGSVTA